MPISWIGGTAGVWSNAANWEDLTTGTVAAVAPGIGNAVTIGSAVTIDNAVTIGPSVTVFGTGSASSLSIQGDAIVAANLNLGTLMVGASFSSAGYIQPDNVYNAGNLEISPGATINATAATNNGTLEVDQAGALFVAGVLVNNPPPAYGEDFRTLTYPAPTGLLVGGLIEAGSLTNEAATNENGGYNFTGTIEIGTAGTARGGRSDH